MERVRAGCHALLNTSRVDNQPVSLIEAMASGLPIVSTDAGGIPDLVQHGTTALLADVGDSQTLGRHLQEVFTDADVYQRLRHAGLEQAETFAWSHVGSAWREIYAGSQRDGTPARATESSDVAARPRGEVRP